MAGENDGVDGCGREGGLHPLAAAVLDVLATGSNNDGLDVWAALDAWRAAGCPRTAPDPRGAEIARLREELHEAHVFVGRTVPDLTAERDRLTEENARLRALLARCAPTIRDLAEPQSGYGFGRPENPHDFFPDAESCTEAEIAAHAAACAAWDAGTYTPPKGSEWIESDGQSIIHILRAPWGIGAYTLHDPDAEALWADVRAHLTADDLAALGVER